MKIYNKIAVGLLSILLLFGLLFILLASGPQFLKAKKDLHMLIFEEVNGLQITASHGDFRDKEAFLEFPIPVSYQLERPDYRLTITLFKNNAMPSRFTIQAVNKQTNERYHIKTEWHRFRCYSMYTNPNTVQKKGDIEFWWYGGGSGSSNTSSCQKIKESGQTEWVEFQLYNNNKQLVATEKLAFHFVKNGYYLSK